MTPQDLRVLRRVAEDCMESLVLLTDHDTEIEVTPVYPTRAQIRVYDLSPQVCLWCFADLTPMHAPCPAQAAALRYSADLPEWTRS